MFENVRPQRSRRKKSSPGRQNRLTNLNNAVEAILLEQDRYHLWWTGPPPDSENFRPIDWGSQHNSSANAIFAMAVMQGQADVQTSSSTHNDLVLYLGTARKFYDGDIVIALEVDNINNEIKQILMHYHVIVYVLPQDLCAKETKSIYCGNEEERVPASVFRYYFYEKWASVYSKDSLLMLSDFRDILFQGNPFDYRRADWFPDHQLAVFQEFHPNMVINRCHFNSRILAECYGEEALRNYGNRVIISSGAVIATRDAMVVWTHHMTQVTGSC